MDAPAAYERALRVLTRRSLASALAASIAVLAWPGIARALPGDQLRPIHGVAYQPAPSDYRECPVDQTCPYHDTDFFNADFRQLWGPADGGRDDLGKMADDLGANLIRLYNWNPARDHLGFLNYAHRKGLRVAVPINNFFVGIQGEDPNAAANIERIVRQVYVDRQGNPSTTPHPAVPIWTVGNEFDLGTNTAEERRARAAKVALATARLVAAENRVGATARLPVSATVTFAISDGQPPAISATQIAIDAMGAEPGLPADFAATRYVAGPQTYNPGSFLRDWLRDFKSSVPNTAVWFPEVGIHVDASCNGFPPSCVPSERQQAAFIAGQWQEAPPGTAGVHLGGAAFEFVNEPWKPGTEATYGLTKFATPASFRIVPTVPGPRQPPPATYRVDKLVDKPAWEALRDAFRPQVLVSSAGGKLAGQRLQRNDIALLDRDTGKASQILDGARVGLGGDRSDRRDRLARRANGGVIRPRPRAPAIDAFTYDRRNDTLLVTLARAEEVRGIGAVGESDVLRYSPRTRRFKRVLRGSDVGLLGSRRDINALALTGAGRLVISTKGAWRRGNLHVRPHDLLLLGPRKRGRAGVARWRLYMRGAAARLTRAGERVDSVWIDPRTDAIHISTVGRFKAAGIRGSARDVVVCQRRRARGACSMRLGWRGRREGLRSKNLTGFAPYRSDSK